jgi:hypothetical protein
MIMQVYHRELSSYAQAGKAVGKDSVRMVDSGIAGTAFGAALAASRQIVRSTGSAHLKRASNRPPFAKTANE